MTWPKGIDCSEVECSASRSSSWLIKRIVAHGFVTKGKSLLGHWVLDFAVYPLDRKCQSGRGAIVRLRSIQRDRPVFLSNLRNFLSYRSTVHFFIDLYKIVFFLALGFATSNFQIILRCCRFFNMLDSTNIFLVESYMRNEQCATELEKSVDLHARNAME